MFVQLEDDLRTHPGPDHNVNLEDREQSRNRTIMGDIVSVDDRLIPAGEVLKMTRQFGYPDTETGETGGKAPGVISVYVRVLIVAQPVYIVCHDLSDTCRRVDTIY